MGLDVAADRHRAGREGDGRGTEIDLGGEGSQGALGDSGGEVEGEGRSGRGFCSSARQLEGIGPCIDDVIEATINEG